jgi:GNAT superfamily N-acetyltransferase
MPNTNDDSLAVSAPRPTDKELIAALGRYEAAGDYASAQRVQQMLHAGQYQQTPAPQKWENPDGNTQGSAHAAGDAGTNDWEVLKYLAGTTAANIGSGLYGLTNLPHNIVSHGFDKGMDDSADQIAEFQRKYGPSDELSPAGVNAVQRHLAPIANAVSNGSHLAGALVPAANLSKYYQPAVDAAAEAAGHVDPRLAGAVGAAGTTAPYAINPDIGPAAAAKGIAKTVVPTSEANLSHLVPGHFSAPDNAISFLAHDPETNQVIGHVTAAPRGGSMQSIRMDVDPAYRGQGVGPSLLQDAVSYAHEQGMPYHSDTQVSPAAAKTYEKLKGVNLSRNPAVDMHQDEYDGPVGRSANGAPVYSIYPSDEADSAQLDEPMPNSMAHQSYAEGGEVEPVVGAVSHLLKKYADLPKETSSASDYVHNLMQWAQGAHPDLVNEHGYPKTFYHGTPVFTTRSGAQLGDIQSFDPMAITATRGNTQQVTKPDGTTFFKTNPGKPKFDSFGSWFSDNPGQGGSGMYAGDDGAIYPVHLNLKNPYQPANWEQFWDDYSKVSPGLPKKPQLWKQHLIDNGYDGMIFPRSSYDGGDQSMVVALHPEQIKSAVGNVGTFDPTSPDITKAAGGPVHMADGGPAEAAPVLGGVAHLLERYPLKDPKIAQAIADHIIEKGGISYDPVSSTQKTSGYAVAVHPGREQIINEPPTAKHIQQYVAKNDDAFQKDPGAHLGAWENGGNWYLDISHITPDLDKAMDLARQHNQKAIFDLDNFQDIQNPHYKEPNTAPAPAPVPPSDRIRSVAQQYMQNAGFPYNPPSGPITVDPVRSKAIADAFENMQHNPQDPRVKAAYDAMIKETMAQYQVAKDAGLRAEFVPHGQAYPYGDDLKSVLRDIQDNNHLHVFPTLPENGQAGGFGQDGLVDLNGHPLLQQSGESFNGQPATYNDIFRVVHDYFGHAKEGNGFRANGEEQAWANHAAMYSPEARPAMTTETRGQNSWVNYGPHGEKNRTASGADTIYAPQKVGLLPDEFSDPSNLGPVKDDTQGYAEGGEAEPLLKGVGNLLHRYAVPNVQAGQIADKLASDGRVTYAPKSGNIPHEGYIVPQQGRTRTFDYTPPAQDIHDFMIEHQDAFQNPLSVLHAETLPTGGTALHVATHTPDFSEAMAAARSQGAPGVHELHTGVNFPDNGDPIGFGTDTPQEQVETPDSLKRHNNYRNTYPAVSRPLDEYDALDQQPIPRAEWTPNQPTVKNAVRVHTPGIYKPVNEVVDEAAALAAKNPEDPLLGQLFPGTSRMSLADIGRGRQGNLLGQHRGMPSSPSGSEAALNIMTPENDQRLRDALTYAMTKPELADGMLGWYVMDPAYDRMHQIVRDPDHMRYLGVNPDVIERAAQDPTKEGNRIWDQLNSFQSISSPQTPVDRELEVAGTAHWLKEAGRWQDFQNASNYRSTGDIPPDMQGLMHHIYHDSQNVPAMERYEASLQGVPHTRLPGQAGGIGNIPMEAPKAYLYGEAANTPEIGNQTMTPVGDTHFAGAVGLLDTRTAADPKGSLDNPEVTTYAPHFRDKVAGPVGLESVPAQALLWGTYAPQTGVRSGIGMPKLELMAQEMKNVADRYGISPEDGRDHYLMGTRPDFPGTSTEP